MRVTAPGNKGGNSASDMRVTAPGNNGGTRLRHESDSSKEQRWNSASDMRVTALGNKGGTRPQI